MTWIVLTSYPQLKRLTSGAMQEQPLTVRKILPGWDPDDRLR
jgi:hypothetical protein